MSPVSRNRKKKSNGKKKRYIPKLISDAVKTRHYFQCAWCGEHLTDRHHIEEFSDGGLHTENNLILLCPNCHRDTHNGNISKQELIKRKSTHLKNDRVSGGIRLSSEQLKIRVQNTLFIDTPNMIVCKDETILGARLENNNLLLSVKLFDLAGNLIFWMSDNRYWCNSDFEIQSGKDKLEIIDKISKKFIKLETTGDIIDLNGRFYYNGSDLNIPLSNMHNCMIEKCTVGIKFN